MASSPQRRGARLPQSDTLADILERVLETGIVVAGDIKVNLNDVELLTIQIRLLVCSVDKADEMGIDWWKNADYLNGGASSASVDDPDDAAALDEMNDRLARLEQRLDRLAAAENESDDGEKS
jgi:hypothetical protein